MKLVLIGASGHGKVCAEIARLSGEYDEILFLDDDENLKRCGEYPVVGRVANFREYNDDTAEYFVSIGNNETRKRIFEEILNVGGRLATLIHKNAVISESVIVGAGSVVMAGAVISSDAVIGRGCIVNTSSSVDHDCAVGDFSHIAVGAHLCGTVSVEKGSFVGAGATVINNVSIGDNSIIGAGAVVVKNVMEPGTYVGVPARRMD